MPGLAPHQHQLKPCWDLRPHLKQLDFISYQLGPDRALYVLARMPLEQPATNFSHPMTDIPTTYVVLRCDHNGITRTEINHPLALSHQTIQPLPNQGLLLACHRSYRRDNDEYYLNAHIFNHKGVLQRSFVIGDGIQYVSTTNDGQIWVGYSDEGVFINYGWHKRILISGLACWSSEGQLLYEYEPPTGLDTIYDCYALNVADNHDTWCYYYADFPLVQIRDYQIVGVWKPPISGIQGFAYADSFVLMNIRDYRYAMFYLEPNGKMEHLWDQTFVDETGQAFKNPDATLRGDCVVIRQSLVFYRVTLAELLT